jgi:18S rRNA (guanine1575-N7)-methyltransferase
MTAVDTAGRRKRPGKAGAARDGERAVFGAGGKRHPHQKSKSWVLKKKEQMRSKGVEVPDDSRYTGRKRKHAF